MAPEPGWLAAAGAGLLLGACGTAPGAGLAGTTFVGDDVTGHDLVAGTEVSLHFEDRGLNASAGCNQLFAEVRWRGDTLVTTELAMTEMGCDPARHAQDDWLADVLTGSPQVTRDGATLRVVGEGASITLVAETDTPLEGTHWLVEGLIEGESVSSLPEGVSASLTVSDGTLTAQLGCNSGSASVTVGATTLELDQPAQTRMACPEPQMAVEHHLTQVLRDEVDHEVDGTTLTLRNGELGLHLVAEDATG